MMSTLESKTNLALFASIESSLSKHEITAPAPSISSIAKRIELSSHFSPAAITPILFDKALACNAIALAFRKQAVNRGFDVISVESSEPFGDGRTSFVLSGISKSDSGDNEYL